MLKKLLNAIILFILLAVSGWCLTFKAYYAANDKIAEKLALGDFPGALHSLETYRERLLSYPFYNFPQLEKFRFRLNYLAGVVYSEVGEIDKASVEFRKAAESMETYIAAASKYNLAYYAMKAINLSKSRTLLNEALMMDPNDLDAKINLELVLEQIQARAELELPDNTQKKDSYKPQPAPGEQWRLDVPDEEGEGSGVSSGRNFL